MCQLSRPTVIALALAVTLAVCHAQVTPTPSVLYSTVLNGVKINGEDGGIYLYQLQFRDLPTPAGSGAYPYNPDGGGKLWAVLASATGGNIARFDLSASRIEPPSWLLQDYRLTDLRANQVSNIDRITVPPGVYRLDFFLEGTHFWSFPFGVSMLSDNSGRRGWFLDGPWEDWAYMFYQDASPYSSLMWKVWLRNKVAASPRTARVHVEITRDGDGAMVCHSNPSVERLLQPWWQRFDLPLEWPANSQRPGQAMDAQTLLASDGAYTATVKVEGQAQGQWKFTVANGQLSLGPRTDPAVADPLTWIQRGVDAWWYEREGAPALVMPSPGAAGEQPAQPEVTPAGGTTPGGAQTGGAATGAGPAQVIPGSTPLSVNGHTMVPLRAIFEWLGADVRYLPQALTVVATRGETTILMRMDENEATVNARRVPMAQPPLQRNGVTYVPLRLVAEAFGCQVSVTPSGAVTITDGDRVGIVR